MFPLWKNLTLKKNSLRMDENKLISLMENFSGSKFQWIKTNKPELLGKVVTCRTIEPKGDKFFAIFDDGSMIDSHQLNTSLLMLHGDMQPLTKAEVDSINGPKRPLQPKPEPIASTTQFNTDTQARPQPQVVAQQPAVNMFEMFNSEERVIDLKLSMNLPDQDFLKMMYSNAKDKNKFLDELSDYIFKMINKTVVQSSISSMVIPQPAVKNERPGVTVNITEIHED